jgi:hypothetical protein
VWLHASEKLGVKQALYGLPHLSLSPSHRMKCSQASVNYRNGAGTHACGFCIMFREPQGCTEVKGAISGGAVCDLFKSDYRRLK